MGVKTGVWIDTKKAVIISLSGNDSRVHVIDSNIEKRERVAGESKQFGRFRDQYLSPEKSKQNRQLAQAKDFFKIITNKLKKAESIVLFGPAQMKFELEKNLKKDQQLNSRLVGVEVADSMTQNQMVAWVKGYFS